jgi:hypothetical protein
MLLCSPSPAVTGNSKSASFRFQPMAKWWPRLLKGNSCWLMMKESGISAQKLAMCRILSLPKPFELLASKIAQFRQDFHLVVVRVESLEGSRLRLPGRCQQRPSRAPPLQGTTAADTPIRRNHVICGCGNAAQ